MSIYTIYKITNIISDKSYIGYTKQSIDQRFKEHIRNKKNYDLSNAIKKEGIDNFTIEVIYQSKNEQHTLTYMEPHFISKYNTFVEGYNMNTGGTGLTKHSEETKKKMSENNYWNGKDRSGNKNPMYGKTHTKESIEKMKKNRKGKTAGEDHPLYGKHHSEETKRKISESRIGKPGSNLGKEFSDEWKNNISISKKGKSNSKLLKKYEVFHPDGTKEIIIGLTEFCKKHNLTIGNMSSVAHGKLPHHKKYRINLL